MLPENRMYFLQVFHNSFCIFFAGGGLGSIKNSNLTLSFFPTSQFFGHSDLPKSNVNISRHIFDNFPPKKCNCSDFWIKKVLSQTLPCTLLSLCSPFAATHFSCFRWRSLTQFNHIGYQPQRFSARLGR